MLYDPRAVLIFTDGSTNPNPGGKSGAAIIVRYPDHLGLSDEEISIGFERSKNNRMELVACIRAFEWIIAEHPWVDVTVVLIVTDSTYVADHIKFHAIEWRRNGWRARSGEPIENRDLWKRILSLWHKAPIRVEFVHTVGKTSPILRAVDNAAKRARDGVRKIDRGYRPGSASRSMFKGAAKRYSASGQVALIRPYRKDVMNSDEEKIRFDTLSDDGLTYVGCFYAYASRAMAGELHRQHGYRVQFNDNPHYPRIVSLLGEISLPPKP